MAARKNKKIKRVADEHLPDEEQKIGVIVRSIDDPGSASDGNPCKLKAVIDKDTGVLTMVAVED